MYNVHICARTQALIVQLDQSRVKLTKKGTSDSSNK